MSNSPPANESPAETANSSGFPSHWTVLGLLVLAHAAFAVCSMQFTSYRHSVLETVCMKTILWQPILFAIWAAFASQRLWVRSVCGFVSCAVVASIDQFGATLCKPPRNADSLVPELLKWFCICTVLLSGLRYFSRWQIVPNPPVIPHPAGQKYQFTIRELIYATTVLAVCCGGVRTLLIVDPGRDVLPMVCPALAYVFPATVVPWIILADRSKLRALLLAILVGGGLVLAEYLLLSENSPSLALRRHIFIQSMLLVQLGSTASATVSFLVLRFCGFRMVRLPKSLRPKEVAAGSGESH
jgi:hypothetical protein